MDFVKYNSEYEVLPIGFDNLGFTCYFNSLLQSLLSCTSFNETVLSLDGTDNILVLCLQQLVKNLKQLDQLQTYKNKLSNSVELSNSTKLNNISSQIEQINYQINQLGPLCWKSMIKKIAEKSPNLARFAIGQQCAAEGFSMFLDSLEKFDDIQNLFLHRRNNRLHCSNCNIWFSSVDEVHNIFEVEADLNANNEEMNIPQTKNLNEFLLNQFGSVDENCRCSQCGIKSKKLRKSSLVMIPEILFIMSKKYKYENGVGKKLNIYTDFPKQLTFTSNTKTPLIYEAVAQIEHVGNLHSGHYYAICRRSGGWFCLNDMGVNSSEFHPTNNTYIVLYHIL